MHNAKNTFFMTSCVLISKLVVFLNKAVVFTGLLQSQVSPPTLHSGQL